MPAKRIISDKIKNELKEISDLKKADTRNLTLPEIRRLVVFLAKQAGILD